MARHFCCCIPVRAGVFIFSLLSFLLSGAAAAVMWLFTYGVHHDSEDVGQVSSTVKTIVIVMGVVYTIEALLALFGFLGACTRNRGYVSAYLRMSWGVFFASLIQAGFTLYAVYSGKGVGECTTTTDGKTSLNKCPPEHFSIGGKIAVTVILIIIILVHLYIVTIIRRYVEQLEDTEAAAGAWRGEYKLTTTDAQQGLLNPGESPYPYQDPVHAHGPGDKMVNPYDEV